MVQSLSAKLINWDLTGNGTPIRLPTDPSKLFLTTASSPPCPTRDLAVVAAAAAVAAHHQSIIRSPTRVSLRVLPYDGLFHDRLPPVGEAGTVYNQTASRSFCRSGSVLLSPALLPHIVLTSHYRDQVSDRPPLPSPPKTSRCLPCPRL